MDTAGLAKAGFMAMLLIAVFGVIAFFFRRCANRFALRCSRAAGLRRARAAEAAAEGGPHGGGWLGPRLGLGYAAIAALPLTELARAAECAVCLGELAAGEAARLLPLCGHAFHVVCVDTWLRFRATCPLCRQAVIHVNVHVDAQPTAPVPAPAEEPILLPPALPQNDDSRAPLAQARDGGGEGSHSLLLVVD